MKVFEVDWDRLNLLLLPTFLRKPLLFAFLRAATAPVWSIYGRFYKSRTETLFLLRYDTSKGNVERVLRKKFEDEGIYIVNNNAIDNAFYLDFYLDGYLNEQGYVVETETVYLDCYLDFYLDPPILKTDFTIMVPAATFDAWEKEIKEIRRYAAMFVLPGFLFDVKRINN